MTRTMQVEMAETDTVDANETVELTDAALEQATGGTFYGTGVYKSTDSGRTWTL